MKSVPTVCGRGMSTSDIQANLELVGKPGSPLALGYWCPFGSRVEAELTMTDSPATSHFGRLRHLPLVSLIHSHCDGGASGGATGPDDFPGTNAG
jgi:hypothetical protein